jgi:alanyl-tRNA synthetase
VTRRLYYTDSMRLTFEATVRACEPRQDHFEILLDQTTFYPTSGGQPFDTGTLNGHPVLDVLDRDDGEVAHVVATPMAVGTPVAGEVHWSRRFDHMQQHSGQHVLSAAFDRVLSVRTLSFHLGAERSTIDVAREVSRDEIARAEDEANSVVWDDRPVQVRFAAPEDTAGLALRKPSDRAGELRLIEIGDFDLSACGGTHVPTTGRIGMIAVAGWERFKGGSRIEFVCGTRALRSYRDFRNITSEAARLLSVRGADLGASIERLQNEARQGSKVVDRLEEELSGYRAQALTARAETINGIAVVLTVQAERDIAALKRLATAIVANPRAIALVIGEGQPAPVVIARSGDVRFDAGDWLKRATQTLGGRGGGRPEHAQGGIAAAPDAIVTFARQSIGSSTDSG